MSRHYTNQLIDAIESGQYTHKIILDEMLCFFSEDQIKDFCLNSFGNEGVFEEEESLDEEVD